MELLEVIKKLAEETNTDEGDIREVLQGYGNPVKTLKGGYAFVTGYTGSEGEGSDINFICRINDDFWRVFGNYDSWNGAEIYWGQSDYLGKCEIVEKEFKVKREVLLNSKGLVIDFLNETLTKKDLEDEESSW